MGGIQNSNLTTHDAHAIVIIGGGFAGLAAGVALAEAGKRVCLLEQNPHLGGRARSFVDPVTGSVVDNGQHLFMGCYHATTRFLQTIGSLDRLYFQPRLAIPFLERDGRLSRLECPDWPSPWHLLGGLLRSRSFSFRQKLEVLRLGRRLRRHQPDSLTGETVSVWLDRRGQSRSLQRDFWDLLSIAALNEDPRIASARIFERVIRLALFSAPADARLGWARTGLSDCYTGAAAAFIAARRGRVQTGCGVRRLLIADGVCRGVELRSGEVLEAACVISAAPWHRLGPLLDPEWRAHPLFAAALTLCPAPIISINLWFDRAITELEYAGLRGTTVQWLFNKGRILGSGEHYVTLVLSGAHEHVARSNEELVALAWSELGPVLPASREAKVLRTSVIKERFATFSPSPPAEAVRPSFRTPIKGFLLAGDWTATGLPATIEGAVQSGYAAAEAAFGPHALAEAIKK